MIISKKKKEFYCQVKSNNEKPAFYSKEKFQRCLSSYLYNFFSFSQQSTVNKTIYQEKARLVIYSTNKFGLLYYVCIDLFESLVIVFGKF